jgi:hypothetical protein
MKSSLSSVLKLFLFLFFLVSTFGLFTNSSQAQSQCSTGEVAFSCGYLTWPDPQYAVSKEACFVKSIAKLKILRSNIRFVGSTGSGSNYQENYCAKQTTATEITRVPVTTVQPSSPSTLTGAPTINPTILDEHPSVTITPTEDFDKNFEDLIRTDQSIDQATRDQSLLTIIICCGLCSVLIVGLMGLLFFLVKKKRKNSVQGESMPVNTEDKKETL